MADASYGAVGKQQSLLSAPPTSARLAKKQTPKVVESSSVPIVNQTYHLSKIVIYVFMVFGIITLILTILGGVNVVDRWALFFIVMIGTILLSIAGALGIYKWGTVQMQIDRFKSQNAKYESQLLQLTSTKKRIAGEVQEVQGAVTKLHKNVDDLQANLHQYDKLKQDLEEIAGDNKDLNDMINDINKMYSGMKSAVVQNQRSSILQIYYDVQFKDKDKGLSKGEYKRFKSRLDAETRERFEKHGNFERLAGADNVIDLAEFQDVLERILLNMEEDLLRQKK